MPPCAKNLEQWTVERMKYLKENQAKSQETSESCFLGTFFWPLGVLLQKPVESENIPRAGNRRLEILGSCQEKLDLPAGWITAMNHMFHTAQRVAVRSMAARYAGSWQVENWYLSQPSGPDLVIEVPLSRWDVDQYFDAEESWQRWR